MSKSGEVHMDDSAERHAADLAAIKAREARVRSEIEAGGPVVDVGPFNMQQLGLTVPVVDRAGRLWRLDGSTLTRIRPETPPAPGSVEVMKLMEEARDQIDAMFGGSKPYPGPMNGDRAEFEAEWAASGRPKEERPDWPLPSFDALDWAKAFCRTFMLQYRGGYNTRPVDDDEALMQTWFANALMRGYDEAVVRMGQAMVPGTIVSERGDG